MSAIDVNVAMIRMKVEMRTWFGTALRTSETSTDDPQSTKKVELGQVRVPLDQGLENGLPQQARPQVVAQAGEPTTAGGIVPFRPAAPVATGTAGQKAHTATPPAEAKPRKVRYTSLLASYEAPPARPERAVPPPPEKFMPFGTLLKCKLVNTVDSANLETPVIAVLLEDVWQNGERVIPANTLVHGTAKAGRLRDRVTAAGTWRFVWQDGRELGMLAIDHLGQRMRKAVTTPDGGVLEYLGQGCLHDALR